MRLNLKRQHLVYKKIINQEINIKKLKMLRIISMTRPKSIITKMILPFYFNNMLKKKFSKAIFFHRCLFTFRAKIMYKRFKISRIYLRDMLKLGLVPGYHKAIW